MSHPHRVASRHDMQAAALGVRSFVGSPSFASPSAPDHDGSPPERLAGTRLLAKAVVFAAILTVALASMLALATPASAAKHPAKKHQPKPKPWMWTPAKASTRLTAAAPFVWDEVELQSSSCIGTGKHVVGRYASFRCRIKFGSINIQPYEADVLIRILPTGSGKLCVMTTPEGKALPHQAGTLGIAVVEGRACPLT